MTKIQYSNLLLNQTKDLIWAVDKNLNLVYANKAYLNLMKEVSGVEKTLNTPILVEGFGEGHIEKWKTYYQRALSGEYFDIEEHFFNPETKEVQYGHVTFSPIKDEHGNFLTVACRSTDITPIIKQKDHASRLMDASLDVFCTIDEDGKFVFVSAVSANHWGYRPEELIGKPYRELIVEEDLEKTDLVATEIMAGREFKSFANRFRKKNGDIAYNMWSARWDQDSKLMFCVARDAKEKMEQENLLLKSEKRFRALIENGADAIVIIGEDGKPNYVSSTIHKLLGYTEEEALELNLFEIIHPDDLGGVINKMNEVMQSPGVPIQGQTSRTRHKDGSWRWLEAVIVNMLHDPDINGIVDNFRDVTERKIEEQRLKLLEKVINSTSDAILITEAEPLDEPGPRIVYVNETFTKMTGYSAEEVIGKNPRLLQGPDSDYEELKKLGEKLKRWEPSEITVLNYTKAGEPFWVNFAVSPVANAKGWFTHWISVQREVTEQKKEEAEKELLSQISQSFNTEDKLIPAANRLCENLCAFGKFDFIELWCPNMEQTEIKLTGYSNHNQDFYDLEPSESSFKKNEGLQGKVWQKGKQLLWDKKQINKDFIRKKGASHLGLQAIIGTPLTFNDDLVGVLLIGTKRESGYLEQYSPLLSRLEKFIGSEINRKRLENNLRNVYDAIPEILCITDLQGRFLKINIAGCEMLGYTKDEVLLHSLNEFTLNEDKGIFEQKIKNQRKKGSIFTFENRFLSKDGRVIWLSWNCKPAMEEGLVYASAKNITEEVHLRELNVQVGVMAKIGSWEVNLETNTIFWSEIVHQLHETNPDSFFPHLETTIDFYREDFRPLVNDNFEKSISTGEGFDYEAVIITKKLKEKWVRVIGNVEIVNGIPRRIYGSFQDIHDQKTFQVALHASEAKFRTIFEIASLGIAQVSPEDGQILLVNSYYEDITGYNVEEMLQMKFSELTHPDDRKRDWDLFSKAAQGEVEYRNEKRYIKKDGSIVWVRIHLAFIRDKDGNPVRTVAICENITERKGIESRLQNLSDNVPGVVFQYVIHPDGRNELNFVSKGSKIIWGFEPAETMANNELIWDRIAVGGDLDLVKESIADSIQTKSRWSATWRYPLPTGEIRTHIGHGSPEFLADGTVVFNSMILDITEEKRTEELLNQTTFMAKIGSWELNLIDQDDDSLYWSPMTREILEVDDNYNPTLTGGLEFYAEEVKEKIQQAVNLLIETGQEFDLELLITPQSGKEKWIRAIGKSERVKGKCIKIYGSLQDIHTAKSNELRISEILDSITDAFYSVDADWNFTYFNKEAENILKQNAEKVLGKNIWEVFSPAKGTILEEVYKRVASTGQSENFEYHYPGDGSWYEFTVYSTGDRLSSYFKNIDERKKADIRLKEANERFEIIAQATNDAIWDWNILEDSIFFGDGYKTLFGHELENNITTIDFWIANIHEEDRERIEKSMFGALKNKLVTTWEDEYRFLKSDGSFAFVNDRGVIIRNKESEAIRMMGAMTDFTQIKKHEKELIEINKSLKNLAKELERSNEELEQFAFITSHDLQEPLRMISSFMDQLKRKYSDQLDEKALQYIHYATDGAKRMKQIILDLLHYSRANKPEEQLDKVSLNEIVSEYMQLRRKLIAEKNAAITFNELPVLETYRAPITQIIHCLLDNALKYMKENEAPHIEILAEEKQEYWEFAIKDNGIGIDKKFYDKIFIIFQRLHNRNERKGTGIGLSIVKRSVEFLGGEIWLESKVGEGTTFYFTIPKK